MKIPLQQKIAELESRIATLEKAVKFHSRITEEFTPMSDLFDSDSVLRGHWNKMWVEFKQIMRASCGR